MNSVPHEKLNGLDRERVLAVVLPVLRAHGVDAVDLIWRADRGGWVLELTVERPGTNEPGAGVTLELCSEISRDLSAALDVADLIHKSYRLEVGSPGLERALYGKSDYARFAGQLARLKLREPHLGNYVVRGTLRGLDAEERVLVELEPGAPVCFPIERIESARLVFEMGGASPRGAKGKKGRAKPLQARGAKPSGKHARFR